jgi:Uma2 family endonuclease
MRAMAPALRRPPKTVEDYLRLPDDVRAELLDGELYYVTPAPSPSHQTVVVNLVRHLAGFVARRRLGRVFVSPIDVYLPRGAIVQPDVLFVRADRMHVVQDAIRGAPDLVIETLSPSRRERDRIVKKRLYAEAEVPEYWIVDLEARAVEVFALAAGAFEPAGWFTGDDAVRSRVLEGLRLPLARIFA